MKTIKLILTACFWLSSMCAFAQMDTTSYVKERQEIKAIVHDPTNGANSAANCRDIVMVGAKGDISFDDKEIKGARAQEKVVFQSVNFVPGTETIRI